MSILKRYKVVLNIGHSGLYGTFVRDSKFFIKADSIEEAEEKVQTIRRSYDGKMLFRNGTGKWFARQFCNVGSLKETVKK